jgi:hypothetical protein
LNFVIQKTDNSDAKDMYMENMKTNDEYLDPRWRTVVAMSGTLNNQDTGLFFSKESSIFKNLEYID